MAPSGEARVILLKLIIVLLLFGSAMSTVAVKSAGHYSSPHLLLYIWVGDALLIWLSPWQRERPTSPSDSEFTHAGGFPILRVLGPRVPAQVDSPDASEGGAA